MKRIMLVLVFVMSLGVMIAHAQTDEDLGDAIDMYWQSDVDSGRDSFESILDDDAGNIVALAYLCAIDRIDGEYERALDNCNRAIEIAPNDGLA